MMGALRDYRAILRVTMVRRADRVIKGMALVGLLNTVGIVLVSGILIARHKMDLVLGLRMLGGLASVWLMLAWCAVFVPRAIMLHSALNARLIPRQRRRLMGLAAAGWLLNTGLLTLALGTWAAFPLVGTSVLGIALILAGNMAGLLPVVLAGNWPLASMVLLPSSTVAALTSTSGLLAASAAMLAGAAYCMRWMFPPGGERNLDRRARQIERMQRVRNGGNWAQNLESGTMSGASVLRLYAFALRRDCGDPTQGRTKPDPGKMLMHAFGPGAHWSYWVGSVGIILAIAAVAHVIIGWRGGASGFGYIIAGSMGGMVSMIVMSTTQLTQAMNRTTGEQALLRLTPLAGAPGLLNRRLATQILRYMLLVWAMLTAAILLANFMIGGSAGLLLLAGLSCLAGQVALTGVLGDHARENGRTLGRLLLAGLLALFEAGVAFGAALLTRTPFGIWMIAIAVVVTALQLHHGWRRMLAAPPAFPARRLALS